MTLKLLDYYFLAIFIYAIIQFMFLFDPNNWSDEFAENATEIKNFFKISLKSEYCGWYSISEKDVEKINKIIDSSVEHARKLTMNYIIIFFSAVFALTIPLSYFADYHNIHKADKNNEVDEKVQIDEIDENLLP